MITAKKTVRRRVEAKSKEPPPPEDGFAIVEYSEYTLLHYFRRRGKKYISMCGVELFSPHLGLNSRLFSMILGMDEQHKWCHHCRKAWQQKVKEALNTLNRDGWANIKITSDIII